MINKKNSLLDQVAEIIERDGYESARFTEGLIFGIGRFGVGVGARASVAKLYLGGEHAGTCANTPGDERFSDAFGLDGLDDLVLFRAANFAQKHNHFDFGIVLVAEDVIDERRARISIAADGNALVNAVRIARYDVVQLVGHAARA